MLKVTGLVKRFGSRTVVNGVSFTVEPGEIVGLLGPNGAGKTTTFYMIVGLVRPDGGRVVLGDRDITQLPVHERARLGIGYLAQEPSVFRKLSVEDNVTMVLEMNGKSHGERRAIVDRLLRDLGLEAVRRQPAYTLSGGERRRVEIARALATAPSYLLLDEPFTGVDPRAVQDLQEIVVYLREAGLGIVITDHNVRETLAITQRAAIMYEGRILLAGTSQEIMESDEARRFYLGERFRL